MKTREEAIENLMMHDIRPSEQRIAVMEYLMEHHIHPSADMIYEKLHHQMPTLSKTTVYNVLRSFSEKRVVQLLTIDDKNVRFDIETMPHAHFRCRCCGELFDLPQPALSEQDAPGFNIDETQVYYSGLCPHCNECTSTEQ